MESLTPESSSKLQVKTVPFTGLGSLNCLACDVTLNVSQPDPSRADRFVAICPGCGTWSLVSHRPDSDVISLISLDGISQELESPPNHKRSKKA